MTWFIVHLFQEQDKFLEKYKSLPEKIKSSVKELIYFQRPDKKLYERDSAMFVGYVFVDMVEERSWDLHYSLKSSGMGEILKDGRLFHKMSDEEVEWVMKEMRTSEDIVLRPGSTVVAKEGPFEGMEGVVIQVVGQNAKIKVPLRRGSVIAEVAIENLELF